MSDSSLLAEVPGNPVMLRAAAVAALGGFLFGYDTGVISGALLFINHDLQSALGDDADVVGVAAWARGR